MLPPGLYEQIINTALDCELSEIPDACKLAVPIDKAEASKILTQYLADVVQKGLENVVHNGGGNWPCQLDCGPHTEHNPRS